MNGHMKGFFRRVAAWRGARKVGQWVLEHELLLTCGHVAYRRGGPHAQFGGCFCTVCSHADITKRGAWGLQ